MGEPINGVGNADGVGGRNPYLVASIVVEARTNVVTSSGVHGESFAAVGTFMGVDFDAEWGKRCFVEIERAVDLGVGRELRIDAGWAEKVQGEGCLR